MNNFFDETLSKLGAVKFPIFDNLSERMSQWATDLNIKVMIFYIIGVVFALLAGALGYRLIKVLLAAGFAYVGYFAGLELFDLIVSSASFSIPGWISYVIGGLCAVLLFLAAFFRFSYALYTALAFIGYHLTIHLTAAHIAEPGLLAIAAGLLLALVAIFFVRLSFVLISSYLGGVFSVGFLGLLLPKVEVLQLGTNNIAFLIVIGLFVVFTVLQLLTTRRPRKA